MKNGITVFAIDDDQDDLELFQEAIKQTDEVIECLTTLDSVDGLAKLQSMRELPDIVFLDINMPRMSGIECLIKIKNDEDLKDIPVVMLSTSITVENERLFDEHQAYHLRKENNFQVFVEKLKQVIVVAQTAER